MCNYTTKQEANVRFKDIHEKNMTISFVSFMTINQNYIYIVFPDVYIKYMWSLTLNIYENTSLIN